MTMRNFCLAIAAVFLSILTLAAQDNVAVLKGKVMIPGFDDGTFDVYNAATYNGFAYSAANNYWYLDPSSFEVDGILPTLVSAAE